MTVVALIVVIAGAAVGGYAGNRLAPPLAPSRTGRAAALIVTVLTAAAGVVFFVSVYAAIRTLTSSDFGALDRDTTVAFDFSNGFWEAGLLLGIAAAVHLLAPAPDEA